MQKTCSLVNVSHLRLCFAGWDEGVSQVRDIHAVVAQSSRFTNLVLNPVMRAILIGNDELKHDLAGM